MSKLENDDWPFDDWLRIAVKVLRISPGEFWAMSLRDWITLTRDSQAKITRSDLTVLMRDFPDDLKGENNDPR